MPRHSYDFPRPALTADIAVFAVRGGREEILLIRRKNPPFRGRWALPGGFVEEGEKVLAAARRELREETGLKGIKLEQFQTYGDPGRDPRGWTVTVVFTARIDAQKAKKIRAGDDAGEARFFPVRKLPPLAFDHRKIVREAAGELGGK